jgi:acyl-CoA hydrolase
MVAVDEKGHPTTVPSLLLESRDEKERWAAAEQRKLTRQNRK